MEPMKPMKPMRPMEPMQPMESLQDASDWWPEGLDSPASTGAQDGWRYAFFPRQRRLAIERNGKVTQFDTQDHAISGVSQEGHADGPVFTSQHGPVNLDELPRID